MTTMNDIETALEARWYGPGHGLAAVREGWLLCTCEGSSFGPLQIEKVDNPDDIRAGWKLDFTPPDLGVDDGDADAWRMVRDGTGAHHELARQLLADYNPAHLAEINGA